MDAGPAGVSAAGVVDLIAGAADKGVDVVGTTLLVLSESELMTSGWHSQMWSWACQYCPPSMTCTRYDQLLASQMTVAGNHRFLTSLRTETPCPTKSGDFFLPPQQS